MQTSKPQAVAADSGRCPYCLPSLTIGGEFNDEHIIPAKLGGTVVVRTHEKCNGQAAAAIDNPFLEDPDVEMLRGLSGVRNTRRGGRARGAQFTGQLEDGARVLIRAGLNGIELRQVTPGLTSSSVTGEFSFTLPAESDDAVAKRTQRILEQLRAEHPGRTVSVGPPEARRAPVMVERSWNLVPSTWPRFAAKVALGVLSLTMPPEWHNSAGELFLMALFRNGRLIGTGEQGVMARPVNLGEEPDHPVYRHLYPWEHSLLVAPRGSAVTVSIVLFGELRYDLTVCTDIKPVGPRVWLCDYRERQPLTFDTLSDYAAAVTERYAEFGEFSAMRHNRPRTQFHGPGLTARMIDPGGIES